MPEDHGCTFDHKSAFRALLELRNPAITGKKLEKV
jgi:hypothetical protein